METFRQYIQWENNKQNSSKKKRSTQAVSTPLAVPKTTGTLKIQLVEEYIFFNRAADTGHGCRVCKCTLILNLASVYRYWCPEMLVQVNYDIWTDLPPPASFFEPPFQTTNNRQPRLPHQPATVRTALLGYTWSTADINRVVSSWVFICMERWGPL